MAANGPERQPRWLRLLTNLSLGYQLLPPPMKATAWLLPLAGAHALGLASPKWFPS